MRPEEPIDQERPFDQGSFLYTRADRRGLIRGGNPLFFSVSGYPVEALLGAPHSVLRHPDMPRGIFHILWQRIESGLPFAGFLKNIGSDGRHYWVCTLVAPSDDGYLSVRSKPGGALFQLARDIYPDMLRAEGDGATPEDSALLFAAGLGGAGFASIQDFMAEALADHAVDPSRGDCDVSRIRTIRADLGRLEETQADLLSTLQKLYLIPTNMRILASRLEPSGGPLSAISDSYKRAASELMARLNRRSADPVGGLAEQDGLGLISTALFQAAAGTLLSRAERQLRSEQSLPGIDQNAERTLISRLVRDFQASAAASTATMTHDVARIGKEAEQIKRMMSGLDQIRILGEVESGRMRNADGGLSAIMAQLTSFHGVIHTRLAAMTNVASRMQAGRD